MLSCCSLSSSLPWASPAAALAGVCRAPELPPSTANVQSAGSNPKQLRPPAPLRLTRLPGPNRKANSSELSFSPLSGSRKAAILAPQCLPGALPCSPSLLAEAASVSVFLMAGAGGEDPKMTRTCLELLGLGNSAGQCPAVTQARPCLPADVSCNGKLLDRVCRGRREGSEERPG